MAFANAAGGTLLLGIEEEDNTTLAKSIQPIPNIVALEHVFRDFLLSCVDPRLPQFDTKAIEIDESGSGVLAIEVMPSRLGPHRVRTSLETPIRRSDKCMPLGMAELHAMVLQNSRHFDEIRTKIASRIQATEADTLAYGGDIAVIGLMTFGDVIDPSLFLAKGTSMRGIPVGSRQQHEELVTFVDSNGIKPIIYKSFGFEDAKAAYEAQMSPDIFGKVVIKVADE